MALQRKRSLFLGLGLTVALALAVPASASAVSTLTGEFLTGSSASGNSGNCSTSTPTFSVSGTATGPSYPGTFTEAGTFSGPVFSSTFTITSGTTTVTGSKTAPPTQGGSGGCSDVNQSALVNQLGIAYTATIHTPSGNFHDEGRTNVTVVITGSAAALTESFTSSLTQPVRLAPTNKDECKNGGWQGFFKNQGECVSSFQRQPQT